MASTVEYLVQQLTIDCLLERVNQSGSIPQEELLVEGAAVLAGTILMSSGISGYGPETHDSMVSLSGLLMKIAAYRDEVLSPADCQNRRLAWRTVA